MHRRTFLIIPAAGYLATCTGVTGDTLTGVTMGTRYSVVLPAGPGRQARAALHAEVERTLAAIVDGMSTFDRDSELSRLNRSTSTTFRYVSPGLFTVLETAVRACEATRGTFDVTVGPLVRLWGFGPSLRNASIPAKASIERTYTRVGRHQLQLDSAAPALAKQHPDVEIDLSSIAKGYGVDQVAALLDAHGVNNYLVDIGGEMRVRGVNADRRAWRIGIEGPPADERRTRDVLELRDHAVATSGNYRDFFQHRGRRYPHVLDPRTGAPVDHGPMSVTVAAASAMWADALATGLLVMGPKAGPRFAEKAGIAALFTVADRGALRSRFTPAMLPLLAS